MYNCGDVCKGECNWEKIPVVDETEKNLYSKIENSIISWSIDGTKTAGSLTREIMELIKERYKK
jgi:hypothetical protein